MDCCRSTVCYINFDQMDINLATLREKINNECDIMVVLKADGYGHGAPQMMKHFLKKDVTWFAVAAVNEAMQLRKTCK